MPRRVTAATTQPAQGYQLFGGNPLAQGLLFATTGGQSTGYVDFVSGKTGTLNGATTAVNTNGISTRPQASSGIITWSGTRLDQHNGAGTLLVCMRGNNNSANWRCFGTREDSSTGDGVYLLYDDVNNVDNGFNCGANNNNYRTNSTNNILGTNSEQSFHTFGFSWDLANNAWLWADGKLDRTASGIGLTPNANSSRITRIGSGSLPSDFLWAYAWNRVLSATEVASITANPWQIFAKPVPRLFLVATGGASVTGALAATEAQDTAALAGALTFTGTLAATEAQDTAAFTGALTFSGSLAATEAQDTAAFSGTAFAPGASGTLAATEDPDTAVFAGALTFTGSLAATEGQDTAAFSGTAFAPGVSGTLAATEVQDTAAFTGLLAFTGALAATEASDIAAFSGTVSALAITGTLATTEAQDFALFYAPLIGSAAGAWIPIQMRRRRHR